MLGGERERERGVEEVGVNAMHKSIAGRYIYFRDHLSCRIFCTWIKLMVLITLLSLSIFSERVLCTYYDYCSRSVGICWHCCCDYAAFMAAPASDNYTEIHKLFFYFFISSITPPPSFLHYLHFSISLFSQWMYHEKIVRFHYFYCQLPSPSSAPTLLLLLFSSAFLLPLN